MEDRSRQTHEEVASYHTTVLEITVQLVQSKKEAEQSSDSMFYKYKERYNTQVGRQTRRLQVNTLQVFYSSVGQSSEWHDAFKGYENVGVKAFALANEMCDLT